MIINYRLYRLYRMSPHNFKDASVQMTQILSLSWPSVIIGCLHLKNYQTRNRFNLSNL